METWEAYQRRRKNTRGKPPRTLQAVYPLSGLLRCGSCRGPLTASSYGSQPGGRYRCANRVQHRGCDGVWVMRGVVEAAVRAELDRWADDIAAEKVTRKRQAAVRTARSEGKRVTAQSPRRPGADQPR